MKPLILSSILFLLISTSYSQVTTTFKVGDKLEVYDPIEKNWFKSTILKTEKDRFFIHYEGYDSKWDTWVDHTRMRAFGEKKSSPVFYLVGSNEDLYNFYVKDEIAMSVFSQDTISYLSGSARDLYSFKKLDGFGFLGGNKIYEDRLYAYWLDNNSFLLSRSYNKVSYYHRDKQKGTELMQNKIINKDMDTLLAQVKRMETRQWAAKKASDKEQQMTALTNFISNYNSRKTDPALEKAITTWWNGTGPVVNPLLKVFISSPDYAIIRNEFGIVTSKQVCVLLVFKKGADGKCYMQWRNMGYEHLGGGAFDTQLKAWSPVDIIFNAENQKLNAAVDYELNCNAVKK